MERTPDRIALVGKEEEGKGIRVEGKKENVLLTYKELNEKSNQLAHLLRLKNVRPDSIVGIMVDSSIEMMVGILSILKAGGGYLPLDPGYPGERLAYMLKDSDVKVLLTTRTLSGKTSFEKEIIFLEDFHNGAAQNPESVTGPAHLAYIMYTSGSTGKAKAVIVDHRSVVRLVKNTNFMKFNPGDRILKTGALDFDASTLEIWGPLLNGLQLHLVSKEAMLTPSRLKETVYKNAITTMWMTSPLFNQMVDEDSEIFKGLRNLIVGGDVLSPPHINRLKNRFPGLTVTNGYGPTENTTFSTTFPIDRQYKENIPIGKPIANSTAYIVDKYNHLAPVGISGELLVGGDGVARGYMNNPELTAEKFVRAINDRLYRTGDLVRWLPDGNIEFFGRIDKQVKIRGYRIELGEIEMQMLELDGIKQVCVIDFKRKSGEKYLCAYYVGDQLLERSKARSFLSKRLPDYMIPSYFIPIETIPLTPNGKVDWRVLPSPEGSSGPEYIAPKTESEKMIAEIWKEVLGLEKVGVEDNFFDVGGTSLDIVRLNSRLKEALKREIPVVDLFRFASVSSLAAYLSREENETGFPGNDRVEAVERGKRDRMRRLQKSRRPDEQ